MPKSSRQTHARTTKTKFLGVLPILRGLLAEASGNEDDPWLRCILAPCSKERHAGQPPFVLDINASEENVRKQVGVAIKKYSAKHGSMPGSILLRGLGSFEVQRMQTTEGRPLENKVAIVTGAAGAIGAGICRGLLKKGCRVAATDIAQDSLRNLLAEFEETDRNRVTGISLDVTDDKSVARGFDRVVRTWGGVDIVVVNAGIAMVASLTEMDPSAFRRLEKVNIEGTLFTIAEAGRCMCRQKTGGDIVVISTKNVFAPGANFGAYSATKTAGHQLGRIASLELAPFGIRVNMVAPDAIFSDGIRKSGLWKEIGPDRMRARGLDEKGLEEYYRNRNLLKAKVTADHVANAVLFFATRQTPTTGATIPVDGGLPDATPR